MAPLADDHPVIRECNNRYGIDLHQGGNGTFAIRSANMTTMPEFYDTKSKRGGQRPPNYFMDRDLTRLCIALSPQNVCELFQLPTKQDALKVIQQAFNSFPESELIPIRVQAHHVLWGEPVGLTRDKMEFHIREAPDNYIPSSTSTPTPTADTHHTTVAPNGDFPTKRTRYEASAPPHNTLQQYSKVVYNGMPFDDDDEARHAYFMDSLDVKYRTQPTNIQHPLLMNENNSTGVYRTDFFVPSLDAYLETTGSEPSARKHFTCELLARHAYYEGRIVFLVYGGLHPPRRDTYSTDGTQTMKIIKYVVEPHTFANGREELVVVAEDGYAWMHKNGAYVIDKLGSIMNRAWDHPPLRAAISMARNKVF
tara:strand:- start:304 stop:1401 length:1098 start_codon:yes stop_codon:yes gene_type:complete